MRNYQLSRMIAEQARKYGNREVLRYKDAAGKWVSVSWLSFESQIRKTALAMAACGIGVQENIATYTPNKPEGLIVDFAAYANRAVVVPLYPTGSLEQLEYIVRDAETDICLSVSSISTTTHGRHWRLVLRWNGLSYSTVRYALPKAIPLRYIFPIL